MIERKGMISEYATIFLFVFKHWHLLRESRVLIFKLLTWDFVKTIEWIFPENKGTQITD